MATERVLRVRRSDVDDDSFVLVKVASSGSAALDLKLTATEGENVFVGSIQPRKVRELRAPNYKGSDEEWEAVLSQCLLQEPVEKQSATANQGTEMVASVEGGSRIAIVIRKNISGITQRLGTTSLRQSDEEEAALFEWTAIAAEAASSAKDEVAELKAKLDMQQETIRRLDAQLEDFLQAKQEHENALLEKFRALLNSKKLKIRDQQRLLAGAKVDVSAAEQVQSARRGTKGRKAQPSRPSKRKANGKALAAESGSDLDEGRRPQTEEEDAGAQRELEEELAEAVTPEKSDYDETEDEEENAFDAAPSSQPRKSGVGSKGKAIETVMHEQPKSPESPGLPPPRRELPFAKKDQRGKAAQPEPKPVRDDDETDDDEL